MDRGSVERMGDSMMAMAIDNLERDGYVAFACLVLSHQNELATFVPESVDSDSKEHLAQKLREIAPHCKCIILISEAWTLSDPNAIKNLAGPIRNSPQREEGIFVQVASRLGELLLTTTFKRNEQGKPVRPTDVKRNWQDAATQNTIFGNFGGLFARAS